MCTHIYILKYVFSRCQGACFLPLRSHAKPFHGKDTEDGSGGRGTTTPIVRGEGQRGPQGPGGARPSGRCSPAGALPGCRAGGSSPGTCVCRERQGDRTVHRSLRGVAVQLPAGSQTRNRWEKHERNSQVRISRRLLWSWRRGAADPPALPTVLASCCGPAVIALLLLCNPSCLGLAHSSLCSASTWQQWHRDAILLAAAVRRAAAWLCWEVSGNKYSFSLGKMQGGNPTLCRDWRSFSSE